MFTSIFSWISTVNWTDWNMWAAIGQIIGAIATVWAVLVALKQTKIGLQQTQLAIEQMEEAGEREKEILFPKIKTNVRMMKQGNEEFINIFLVNTKHAPIYYSATQ